MELHSRLNSSMDTVAAPGAGDSISMIADSSLADMLRQAMFENNPEDKDVQETEELSSIDDDMELDLHSMGDKIAPALSVPISGVSQSKISSVDSSDVLPPLKTESNTNNEMPSITEDFDDEEGVQERSDGDSSDPVDYKKYVIVAVIVVAVIALAILIKVVTTASSSNVPKESVSQTVSTAESSKSEFNIQRFSNDVLTATDTQTYQDSMTITKYIELTNDSCLFVFEGYAENARAFIKMYVDLESYNMYKTGARVPILYEHIIIENKDYYMKARLNL